MSERGDAPEGFLQRWSRKKAEAQHEPEAAPPAEGAAGSNPPAVPAPHVAETAESAQEPAFDIASLPPIESITATTDVRSFLAPGVPRELARAALRRAWASDPAIRDFVGLQENDWDFNNPEGVPGFGRIAPGEDLKKLVAQVFGEPDAEPAGAAAGDRLAQLPESQAKSAAQDAIAPPSPSERDGPGTSPPSDEHGGESDRADSAIVQRTNNVAAQNDDADASPAAPPPVRKHGRALPE